MMARIVLTLALFAIPISGRSIDQDPPPADRWIPGDALLCLELAHPDVFFDLLRDEEIIEFVTSSAGWRAFCEKDDYQKLSGGVGYLEAALGLDWRTALQRLTGGGMTLAVGPNQETLLIVEAMDQDLLARLHEILLMISRSEAAKAGDAARVRSNLRRNREIWTFDGKEKHVIIGNRLLLANRADILDAALDLVDGKENRSLAASDGYRAARRAAGSTAAALFWADLSRLKHLPGLARALDRGRENPIAALLSAGVPGALLEASWLGVAFEVQSGGFSLHARFDGSASDRAGAAAFAWPQSKSDGPLPNLDVPGRIAAASFYRDLHRFYAGKDELFPERTSSLIFFENMMGIFFSGRDLTDEVFASTRPDLRFVVAEQRYDESIGIPEVEFPAFAAVIGIREIESFSEIIEEAWQKALGLVNFTRGQNAQPGLIIDRKERGGTKYTFAYFSSRNVEKGAKLHERFNFCPTLAFPGEWVVLSSTETLACDLIDALAREAQCASAPLPDVNTVMEIDGEQLSAILAANREGLVRSNMINEGNTREEAEAAIDSLLDIARLVGSVSFTIGADALHTTADLDVRLIRPKRAARGAVDRPGSESGRARR